MLLENFKEKEYEVQEIHNSSFKKFARFKNHLLENEQSDEQPRYFYVYKIGHPVSHEQFYLCEIDNSDSKKNISTLVIIADNNAELSLEKNLYLFKNSILAQSLSWPKVFLSETLRIARFTTINHPSKNIQSDQTYYANWAERILEKVKSI